MKKKRKCIEMELMRICYALFRFGLWTKNLYTCEAINMKPIQITFNMVEEN